MKEWLIEHKMYFFVGIFIACAGIVYVDFYHSNSGYTPKTEDVVNKLQSIPEKKEEKSSPQSQKVMVDVKGQIKHPGVYQSSPDERVIDVITRAGGLTANANETAVNFAEHVQDEMVIYIPAKGEESQAGPTPTGGNTVLAAGHTGSSDKGTKVNINKADATELQNLPGIGQAKAAAIVEYREKNGPFKTADDLKNISGIGDKTFEKLKDMVDVH